MLPGSAASICYRIAMNNAAVELSNASLSGHPQQMAIDWRRVGILTVWVMLILGSWGIVGGLGYLGLLGLRLLGLRLLGIA